ncbi:cyclase family protein, partial [Novosphingobium sp. Chol11]|uniref:cyclase family protein n=1 Tax=Novosphingobium sp. Chol11 TaxID=1385763 RepID=UPI0025D2581F
MGIVGQLAAALGGGSVRVIDLTQALSPQTPALELPPEFGQCAGFSSREVSRYDERGVAWYWNEFTMNEHTGTHFDAPVHWISGRDLPNNTTDTIAPEHLLAPAVVIDLTAEAAADPDLIIEPAHLESWEAVHGPIPSGAWLLLRTDWSKRSEADYTNRREDGAHTPGPSADAVRFMLERGVHGLGVET